MEINSQASADLRREYICKNILQQSFRKGEKIWAEAIFDSKEYACGRGKAQLSDVNGKVDLRERGIEEEQW